MKIKTSSTYRRAGALQLAMLVAAGSYWATAQSMAHAVTLHPGDIVAAGFDSLPEDVVNGVVYQIDPITGAHTVISDSTHGTGPLMHRVSWVSMAADGQLWIVDAGVSGGLLPAQTYPFQIFKVDPVTGDRTAFSNLGQTFSGGARDNAGRLILGLPGGGIVDVNAITGATTLLPGTNGGPEFAGSGIIVSSDNTAFMASVLVGVNRVDLTTGAQFALSSIGTDFFPVDVARDAAGNLLASSYFGGVFRIDPITGNRTLISGATVGTGVWLDSMTLGRLAVGGDGAIYVAVESGFPGVLKIDPITGNRQLLADLTGITSHIEGVAIVPANVPEPATLLLATLGGLMLIALGRRRRHCAAVHPTAARRIDKDLPTLHLTAAPSPSTRKSSHALGTRHAKPSAVA